jgi:hypothetical protein
VTQTAFVVNLCQNCPKSTGSVGHARGGIHDERVLLICLWESHYWFQGELLLESKEGL